MKLVIPILFLLLPQLRLLAQELSNELIFKLEVGIIKDVYPNDPMTYIFVISGSNNKTDTLFTIDTTKVKYDLEPETDYNISVYVSDFNYLMVKSNISTKGHSTSKKFMEDYIMCNIPFHPSEVITFENINYTLNNFKKPIFKDSTNDVFSFVKSLLDDNPNLLAFELKGLRLKKEKEAISLKRAEYFKNELIKMGIDKDRLVIEDGGVCEEDNCENLLRLRILSFAK